jgi:hypothetical protein
MFNKAVNRKDRYRTRVRNAPGQYESKARNINKRVSISHSCKKERFPNGLQLHRKDCFHDESRKSAPYLEAGGNVREGLALKQPGPKKAISPKADGLSFRIVS